MYIIYTMCMYIHILYVYDIYYVYVYVYIEVGPQEVKPTSARRLYMHVYVGTYNYIVTIFY